MITIGKDLTRHYSKAVPVKEEWSLMTIDFCAVLIITITGWPSQPVPRPDDPNLYNG